jgi:hypothetical protein
VVIISSVFIGCQTVVVPDIISVGECERGIVTDINLKYVQELWPQAQITDILISGGCYQERLIKKR